MAFFKPINETLFELQKEYWNPNLWEFYFDDEPSIRFLIKSTTIPLLKFETETRNSGHKVLMKFEPEEDFSIEFNETADFTVMKFMEKWMGNIYDQKTRKFKTGGSYVKQATVTFFKYTRSDILIPTNGESTYSYRFMNMMITGIENIDLTYDTSENKTVICNFTVDQIIRSSAVPIPIV